MFGGIYVTVADWLSANGVYPDNSQPPYQKQSVRKLMRTYANVAAPTSKQGFYAGQGYWYDQSKKKAVSWNQTAIYYKGKFAQVTLFTEPVICACITDTPSNKKVICYVTSFQLANGSYRVKVYYLKVLPSTNNTPLGQFEFQIITADTKTVSNTATEAAHPTFGSFSYSGKYFSLTFISGFKSVVTKVAIDPTTLNLTATKILTLENDAYSAPTHTTSVGTGIVTNQLQSVQGHRVITATLSGAILHSRTGGKIMTGRMLGDVYHYVLVRAVDPEAIYSGAATQDTVFDLNHSPYLGTGSKASNTSSALRTTISIRYCTYDFSTGVQAEQEIAQHHVSIVQTINGATNVAGTHDGIVWSLTSLDDNNNNTTESRGIILTRVAFAPEKKLVVYVIRDTTTTTSIITSEAIAAPNTTLTTTTDVTTDTVIEVWAIKDGVKRSVHRATETETTNNTEIQPFFNTVQRTNFGYVEANDLDFFSDFELPVTNPIIPPPNDAENGKVLMAYQTSGRAFTLSIDLVKTPMVFAYEDFQDEHGGWAQFKSLPLSVTSL